MKARSAGILLYRRRPDGLQVLLAHPGGPYWQKKDDGAWTLPKGEMAEDEDAEVAARREFFEETGLFVEAPLLSLGTLRQAGGKAVAAFAAEGDLDPAGMTSNIFSMEWPPRSGRTQTFPEIDRVAWYGIAEAHGKILPSQRPFLDALSNELHGPAA